MNEKYRFLKWEQIKGLRLLTPLLTTASYDELVLMTTRPPQIDWSFIFLCFDGIDRPKK